MGIKSCQIHLNRQSSTYFAGETLTGYVEYVFDSPRRITCIRLRIIGIGLMREKRRTHNFEEYLKEDQNLLAENIGETEILPGRYSYPFIFSLPPRLPSSFEGNYGGIRYILTVTHHNHSSRYDAQKRLTIKSRVDLNLYPEFKRPFKLELEKTFYKFLCNKKSVIFNLRIPVMGYIPGQLIPISAECINSTNIHVTSVKCVLRLLVTYYLYLKRYNKRVKYTKWIDGIIPEIVAISKLDLGPVTPYNTKKWKRYLKVPLFQPWNLINCKIIDCDYQMHVRIEFPFPHTNLIGKIPILIGTLPYNALCEPEPPIDDSFAVFSNIHTMNNFLNTSVYSVDDFSSFAEEV